MKKTGVLNHQLAEVIAAMRHTDMLVVADAGLPVPPGVQRIDLAVSAGLPSMLDVARAIASELQTEGLIVAEELIQRSGDFPAQLAALFPTAELKHVPHERFKELTRGARAVARTGECSPYANVILVSGVTF